jgi:hypothetical protein
MATRYPGVEGARGLLKDFIARTVADWRSVLAAELRVRVPRIATGGRGSRRRWRYSIRAGCRGRQGSAGSNAQFTVGDRRRPAKSLSLLLEVR